MGPVRAFLLSIVLSAGLAACEGGAADPPSVEPVACDFPYPAPSGWIEGESAQMPQGTHIGTQSWYERGPRVVVYSAGMLRDQFETAPMRDGLPLVGGGTASLFAIAEPPTARGYTVFWYGAEPCKQYAVDGVEGFASPSEFLTVMRELGVLAPKNVSGPGP